MQDVKIVRVFETQRVNESGQVETVIRTTFNVGPDGPFQVDMIKGDYTGAAARALAQKLADQVNITHEAG